MKLKVDIDFEELFEDTLTSFSGDYRLESAHVNDRGFLDLDFGISTNGGLEISDLDPT